MKTFRPVDAVVFLIALTVCLVIVLSAAFPLFTGEPLVDARAKMLAGVVGSMVAVVTLYVGAEIQRIKDKD